MAITAGIAGRTDFLVTVDHDFIAQLLVERERLVLERVEVGAETALLPRVVLGQFHELRPELLPAQLIGEPELRDVQPPPLDLAEQAAEDAVVSIANEDGDRLDVRLANHLHVERAQAVEDGLRIGGRG